MSEHPQQRQEAEGGIHQFIDTSGATIGPTVDQNFNGAHIGPHTEENFSGARIGGMHAEHVDGGINVTIGSPRDVTAEKEKTAAREETTTKKAATHEEKPASEEKGKGTNQEAKEQKDVTYKLTQGEFDMLVLATKVKLRRKEVTPEELGKVLEQAVKDVIGVAAKEKRARKDVKVYSLEDFKTALGIGKKKEEEPKEEYALTDAELASAVRRLKKAFPLEGNKEPPDEGIMFIVKDEMLKRGEKAETPKDAKVLTIAQIRDAYKRPEKKEQKEEASFQMTPFEFKYVVKRLLEWKVTADKLSVIDVQRIKLDPARRRGGEQPRTYTLDDIRKALGSEGAGGQTDKSARKDDKDGNAPPPEKEAPDGGYQYSKAEMASVVKSLADQMIDPQNLTAEDIRAISYPVEEHAERGAVTLEDLKQALAEELGKRAGGEHEGFKPKTKEELEAIAPEPYKVTYNGATYDIRQVMDNADKLARVRDAFGIEGKERTSTQKGIVGDLAIALDIAIRNGLQPIEEKK
ncbi:MAG: hypothetical protein WC659_05255 [Patescibacteria group bacterium]